MQIYQEPTYKHFDPEKAIICVVDQYNYPVYITITYPWTFQRSYHVCPGGIELEDRFGKKVEIFCFGGTLKIYNLIDVTACVLDSPAPILQMIGIDSVNSMLIEEMEILFAQRKAALHGTKKFTEHLTSVDPLNLYLSCLVTLKNKFNGFPCKWLPHVCKFLDLLHKEIQNLYRSNLWPSQIPPLAEIL
jgi:hypothetical protein